MNALKAARLSTNISTIQMPKENFLIIFASMLTTFSLSPEFRL